MSREDELRHAYPWIDWDEPIELRNIGETTIHYGCRYCISMHGIKGGDIPDQPTDPDEVRAHIWATHRKAN